MKGSVPKMSEEYSIYVVYASHNIMSHGLTKQRLVPQFP